MRDGQPGTRKKHMPRSQSARQDLTETHSRTMQACTQRIDKCDNHVTAGRRQHARAAGSSMRSIGPRGMRREPNLLPHLAIRVCSSRCASAARMKKRMDQHVRHPSMAPLADHSAKNPSDSADPVTRGPRPQAASGHDGKRCRANEASQK